MKKILAILLCMTLVLSFAACGAKEEPAADAAEPAETAAEETAESAAEETDGESTEEPAAEAPVGMPNPLVEVTLDEMNEKLGLGIAAPESAEDVKCFVLMDQIARMDFVLDGQAATLLAMATDMTEWNDEEADLSGLFYEFEAAETKVADRDGMVYVNADEGVGYIAWLDVVPGIVYNVSMLENASVDALSAIAEAVFTPAQGNN